MRQLVVCFRCQHSSAPAAFSIFLCHKPRRPRRPPGECPVSQSVSQSHLCSCARLMCHVQSPSLLLMRQRLLGRAGRPQLPHAHTVYIHSRRRRYITLQDNVIAGLYWPLSCVCARHRDGTLADLHTCTCRLLTAAHRRCHIQSLARSALSMSSAPMLRCYRPAAN